MASLQLCGGISCSFVRDMGEFGLLGRAESFLTNIMGVGKVGSQ